MFEDLSRKVTEIDTERKVLESKVYQELTRLQNYHDVLREQSKAS